LHAIPYCQEQPRFRERQTKLFYEKVPLIGYGNLFGLRALRSTVKGYNEKTDRNRLYNVWLEK